jgi:prepilin-type N-terminal cleavage/methylation domain-containing protein
MSKNKYITISYGFTLLELLIVMAIIGIMATILMVLVNPARQLAKARDSERRSDIYAIVSAIDRYATEHSGALPDTDGDEETSNFPTNPTCIGTGGGCFNLAGAGETGETIVPEYMYEIPTDPKTGDQSDTGYQIYVDGNNYIHASASAETETDISVVR